MLKPIKKTKVAAPYKKIKGPKGFGQKTLRAMKDAKAKPGEKVKLRYNKDGSLKSITQGNKTYAQKGKPKRKDSHVKVYRKHIKSGSRKK